MLATEKSKTYYGEFGGLYIPESLVAPIKELSIYFEKIKSDDKFLQELDSYLKNYAGRSTHSLNGSEKIPENSEWSSCIFKTRGFITHRGS